MDRRRRAWIGLAFGLLVVACQPGAPSPSPATTSQPSPAIGEPSAPPPAGATIGPDWIARPALTCGEPDRLFPPEALQGPGLAELGPDPAAAVLRTVIADAPPETTFPGSGWHRVVDRPDAVTFIGKGDADTPWWVVTVAELGGTLQATEYGRCHLSIAPPAGVTLAWWWLDPDGPPITPETTTLAVLLRERACASGRTPEGRVMEPTIVTTPETIVVAIGVRERPGGDDCPGNPAFPLELALAEPVGTRRLFDASEFPPRAVTAEEPR